MNIGQYRTIKKIGEGGMSAVYLAEHNMLGKKVALKLLPTSLSDNKDIRERFLREAKILAKLNHPNIVTLHDFFEQQENLYLVMELVDGQTLDALIREKGTIPLSSCMPLFKQILAGVGFAHAKGIIHRDLKPSNVMINQDGLVKITDFGIAKLSGDVRKTRTGIKLGTLWYMAPESIRGQEATPQTDIYSLGITFFEMITGRVPFTGDSEYHIMQTILEATPPSIKDFTADVPNHIEKAILKALAKSPADRFQTTQDFLQALQRVNPSPAQDDDQTRTVHIPLEDMETRPLRPGSVFAKRYEILAEGKKGGMGVVYKVRDQKLNRTQALKVIRPQLSYAPQAMQRFRQEVSISLELMHPNIVRVHNLDEYEGIEYFTMEWVEGKNLRDVIAERKKEKRPFALGEVNEIMNQMTDALRYAHRHTVHRDIKPENILVTQTERGLQLKLTDFGIAKILSPSEFVSATIQMGTPYYMSPEQKEDSSKVDLRSDIYSVGVILFELITLENTLGPELPTELNPTLPPGIDAVYRKAVALRPENRYQNMDEFLDAFHKVLSEENNVQVAVKENLKIDTSRESETAKQLPLTVSEETEEERSQTPIADEPSIIPVMDPHQTSSILEDHVAATKGLRHDQSFGKEPQEPVLSQRTEIGLTVPEPEIKTQAERIETPFAISEEKRPVKKKIWVFASGIGLALLIVLSFILFNQKENLVAPETTSNIAINQQTSEAEQKTALQDQEKERKRIEQERLQREEYQKMALEQKKKNELEQQRMTAETKKMESEKKQEDENRKLQEQKRVIEEKQRQASEKERLEAEQRQRQERERLQREADQKRRNEEEQQRIIAEIKKAEAEKKQEIEMINLQEQKRMAEERQRLAAEKIRTEEENRKQKQTEMAKKSAADATAERIFTNSIGMRFVKIPAGRFMMGSPNHEPRRGGDETLHQVLITRTYYMQTTEVTQGQWKAIIGQNPAFHKNCGDNCPVESINWDMVQDFIEKLNRKEKGMKYRLPTESEWEYACRAGNTTAYSFGDDENHLNDNGWFSDNSQKKVTPVGQKKPNPWGLFDMHGNVFEWSQDRYGSYPFSPTNPAVNPEGPNSGLGRIIRGGGWNSPPATARSAYRGKVSQGSSSSSLGFRLVREISVE